MMATEAARSGDAGVRPNVCKALASLGFSGRTPVSESAIQVVKDFMKDWLQMTRRSLERSVLPLLPDPAAREQATGHFRSHLGWLDGLGTRKLEMAFLKDHLGTSLVLPLKRELPIKKKKKRKLDSSEGAKEVNHCWDHACSSRSKRGSSTTPSSATSCSCLLYTSPSPRDLSTSRMPSSA